MLNAEPEHEIPERLKRECDRCKERGERYERQAAGHGTVEEIREAISALELVKRQGLPLGRKIRVSGEWVCPRCTSVTVDEKAGKPTEVPIIERLGNREQRRRRKLRLN